MNRTILGVLLALLALPPSSRADIVLDAADLNYTLKKMARLKLAVEKVSPQQSEAIFQLGKEGLLLADLLSRELSAHGWEQKALIDLALERTASLGVTIRYHPSTLGFQYDAKALVEYLEEQPDGEWAAQAKRLLLSWIQSFPLAGWDRLRKTESSLP